MWRIPLTVLKGTPTISWDTPAAITYGTALNVTQLDASSPIAGTFSYTPAAATVPSGGEQTLTVTFIPADTTNYTKATASVALTVNQATPAIKLISSATSIVSGGSVRFTAAATGTGVTPAGNVMFFDGAKQLSSDPLSGGVAKFATTELAVGKHSITATYVGNGDYGSATSTAISVTVTAK